MSQPADYKLFPKGRGQGHVISFRILRPLKYLWNGCSRHVIPRLQAFWCAIRRTFVQYFTRFQLTACLRGPSKTTTAGLLVPDVVVFGFQDGRAEGKWEVVQGECHDLDSGAEFFGDDLPFYRNSSISYTTILWNANIHITLLCNNVEVDWKAMRVWKTNRGCMPRPILDMVLIMHVAPLLIASAPPLAHSAPPPQNSWLRAWTFAAMMWRFIELLRSLVVYSRPLDKQWRKYPFHIENPTYKMSCQTFAVTRPN